MQAFRFLLSRGSDSLPSRQTPIHALASHQLVMSATLDHPPGLKHIYHISMLDGAKTMSDGDGGTTFGCGVEGLLDGAFGGGVKGGRGLVEESVEDGCQT